MGYMKQLAQEVQELGFHKGDGDILYWQQYPQGKYYCTVIVRKDYRIFREHPGGYGIEYAEGTSLYDTIPGDGPSLAYEQAREALEEIEDRLAQGQDDEYLTREKAKLEKELRGE